jgi:hypothetical protein
MGAFNINITGVGGHGCERKAKPGEKLYGRCGRFSCPDCVAFDFVQTLRQKGMLHENGVAYSAEVTSETQLQEARAYIANQPPDFTGAPRFFESDGKVFEQLPHSALFTHWPGQPATVVDDMLKNERKVGQF